ncbi:hypothetical protein HOY80DRAFT_953235 [Tuber brumale]|nr:hypothetical protein HOY80DRAFT_953235 [Tuber brumale]
MNLQRPGHLFSLLLLLIFHAASTTARCTINYNTSFSLTTDRSLNPDLNNLHPYLSNSQLTISPPDRPFPVSVIPFFRDGGIYRYVDGGGPEDLEQGYLEKNPGGPETGYAFKFGRSVPTGAIAGRFEIGCSAQGRHILSLNGDLRWQACGGGYGGEWRVSSGYPFRASLLLRGRRGMRLTRHDRLVGGSMMGFVRRQICGFGSIMFGRCKDGWGKELKTDLAFGPSFERGVNYSVYSVGRSVGGYLRTRINSCTASLFSRQHNLLPLEYNHSPKLQ